ncbi:hypothetical protein, partial [Candidatus Sodalis sp. SoCistrobi]|uniref:hypothetical protein n=1 Tax=Candidatus Sodalis sp. SoCistrobi TaxID=1922216 RepID=UPI001C280059
IAIPYGCQPPVFFGGGGVYSGCGVGLMSFSDMCFSINFSGGVTTFFSDIGLNLCCIVGVRRF